MTRQHFRMLIDDRWANSSSGELISSLNPATEEEFATFPSASGDDVEAAVCAAHRAFPLWAATSASTRAELLKRIAQGVRARASELALLETLDAGKPVWDTTNFDIPDAASFFDYFASSIDEVRGESLPISADIQDYTQYSPVGVVALITSWNFPLVNAAWKIAPAIAVGNTVVFKPSELASLTSLKLGEIIQEAGVPPGVVNVISGYGGKTGATLVAHPGIAKVSFTGSTATGRTVLKSSSLKLIPTTLELGGKSPNIVLEDADMEQAVAGVLFGIFFNAGQVCTAGSRLLVNKAVYDEFLERFLDRTRKIPIGPGINPEVRLGPLISKEQRDRVLGYIDTGIREGGRIIHRANVPMGKGYFVGPTVFDRVAPNMKIAREEIFGPVLCVFPFETEAEAIAIANDSEYGLAAGIWSSDLDRANHLAKRLDAGTVWINTYNFVTPRMPAPTRKQSGIGVELGRQGMEAYTHLKNVVVNLKRQPLEYFP